MITGIKVWLHNDETGNPGGLEYAKIEPLLKKGFIEGHFLTLVQLQILSRLFYQAGMCFQANGSRTIDEVYKEYGVTE